MRLTKRGALRLLLLLTLLLAAPVARAQDEDEDDAGDSPRSGLTVDVTAGFDGFYKQGTWVPVQISLRNDGSPLEGYLQIEVNPRGADVGDRYEVPISLPTRSNKVVELPVYLLSFENRITVDLRDEAGSIITRAFSNVLSRVDNGVLLYGVVSDAPGELTYLETATGGRSRAAVGFVGLDELPEVQPAWQALDVLVLDGVDTGRLTPARRAALESWVEQGGQLVVTGGAGWQQTTAPLADLLPVTPTGARTVDQLPTLSAWAGFPFRDPGPYLLTESSLTGGESLLQADDVPLLARRSLGRGDVYFLALDPAAPPLIDWDGSQLLWNTVAESRTPLPFYATGVKQAFAAQRAVSTLASLTLPSVWGVALFLAVYVFAVGPLNYVVLRRLKRIELAWLTIPALILLFSAVTYAVGFRSRGNNVILNQMAVVFGDTASGDARAQTLLGVYSPSRRNYDVRLPLETAARPLTDEFASVSTRFGAVERGESLLLRDIQVDVGSSEEFVIDGAGTLPDVDGEAILRLEDGAFLLDVTVRNNGETTLEDATLLFGAVITRIGDLEPGDTFTNSRRLTSAQVSDAAAQTSGAAGGFLPRMPGGSPLQTYQNDVIGNDSPMGGFDNAAIRARADLLESLHYSFGANANYIPRATVTLIGWSDVAQVAIDVVDRSSEVEATTLYFIELPFTAEAFVASGPAEIAPPFWNNAILDSRNVFTQGLENIILTNAAIEIEFTPWEEFRNVRVDSLSLTMEPLLYFDDEVPLLPLVEIWNWETESWDRVDVTGYGSIPIETPAPYLGPQRQVRVRLENSDFTEVRIQQIYPVLKGVLE